MKGRYEPRARVGELTVQQKAEFLFGPRDRNGLRAFADDNEAQDLWAVHRDALFLEFGDAMLRSYAYRRFDLGEHLLPTTEELTLPDGTVCG